MAWFGLLAFANKVKINSFIRMAIQIVGSNENSIDQFYGMGVHRKCVVISKDTTQSVNYAFELLPSDQYYRTSSKAIYKQICTINILNKFVFVGYTLF